MRLFPFLCKNVRRLQNINRVPLMAPRLPFRLRDRVSGRKTETAGKSSIQETTNLLITLRNHDYNEQYCQKEIERLQAANQADYDAWQARKEQSKSRAYQPGRDLKGLQLNKFLKKFPEPKKNDF